MKTITNTTEQAGALAWIGRPDPRAVEAQEAKGQQELVESTSLPAEGDWAKLEEMGVKRCEPVEQDRLFVNATLPQGWKKEPTEHSMWSNLVDDTGKVRAQIFYKAVFYDRDAFITVC
jgi:hypothetical protein